MRWQGLHEDLHATTQVLAESVWRPHAATQMPAQLVELAAAWERWWSLGSCGPGCGPADVLGKGLAEGPTRVSLRHRGRPWQDLVDFLGKDLAKDRRLLVPI